MASISAIMYWGKLLVHDAYIFKRGKAQINCIIPCPKGSSSRVQIFIAQKSKGQVVH